MVWRDRPSHCSSVRRWSLPVLVFNDITSPSNPRRHRVPPLRHQPTTFQTRQKIFLIKSCVLFTAALTDCLLASPTPLFDILAAPSIAGSLLFIIYNLISSNASTKKCTNRQQSRQLEHSQFTESSSALAKLETATHTGRSLSEPSKSLIKNFCFDARSVTVCTPNILWHSHSRTTTTMPLL